MSTAIFSKDLTLFSRDALVKGLLAITVVLVLGSMLTGLQREQVFDKEKNAALETDEAVWMNQGDRNPHSAAHFSRYAFRPSSPLQMLDPGTTDFAGLAIWMEAHYQDPAVFRRAEDSGELSRFTQLTPAFLLLTVAPLLISLMLFSSVAGEREDGTLRQLLATGVNARQFFLGKLGAGLRLSIFWYTLVFIPVALFSLLTTPADVGGDAWLRLSALFVSFAAYLSIFVAIAVGVSALFRSRQAAFLALTCVWALLTIIVPRFASDFATSLYPQPDAREAAAQLSAASSTFYSDPERGSRLEQELLDEYNVASLDELPISYAGYRLQVAEDLAEPEFDRFYASLADLYVLQESVTRWFSLITPSLAATNLSRGLAGTDGIHQQSFAKAAEDHRREMIQMLNEDYMNNAGAAGAAYTANTELWDQFEDFDHEVPALSQVAGNYLRDSLLLLIWLVVATTIAYRLVGRAVRGEVPTA